MVNSNILVGGPDLAHRLLFACIKGYKYYSLTLRKATPWASLPSLEMKCLLARKSKASQVFHDALKWTEGKEKKGQERFAFLYFLKDH